MRYEIKHEKGKLKVWDTKNKVWITTELPSMEVAKEICDDFNAMDKKDFRPLGLPNFSKGR